MQPTITPLSFLVPPNFRHTELARLMPLGITGKLHIKVVLLLLGLELLQICRCLKIFQESLNWQQL